MRPAIIVAVLLIAGVAHAYPQFELVKDQTCSSCHLSPAGGGLLGENGLNVAESMSQWGQAPDPFYGKVKLPSWLTLGGDIRAAGGLDVPNGRAEPVVFPMQFEIYAAATYKQFSLHVTAGLRDPQYVPEDSYDPSTLVASREHWLQWQQEEGSTNGLFVRVGRFMPVFGLRFAEHPYFDRRYGGAPLYDETYAAAVEYIQPEWEVHATGFIKDFLLPDSIERGNGAAFYAEARVTETTALGVEEKIDIADHDHHYYTGVTAKQKLSDELLIEGELEYVRQHVGGDVNINQLVGEAVGSYFKGPFMIDLGIGIFHQNLTYKLLDLEALDVNVHWFATSHVELLLTNRLQTRAFGADVPAGTVPTAYSLLQLHYRI